jgi:mono/diheme cytochrome c family protein
MRALPATLVVLTVLLASGLPVGDAAAQVDGDGSVAVDGAAAPPVPTYYGAVQDALRRNCTGCHRANAPDLGGMVAPMSLTTYEDARRYAARIADAVSSGYMPPWGADAQHQGLFKDERYLSDEDEHALVAWVDGGAPLGDPAEAPAPVGAAGQPLAVAEPVEAPDGSMWWMGVPDLVVGFKEPVLVCEAVEDWQPQLRMHVPDGALTEPRWIRGMEIRPGSNIVHHTVSSHLGVGVPGRGPFVFPKGWGILLTENPFITISMHYHKETGPGTEVVDDTKGGFAFYEDGEVIDYVVETDIQAFTDFTIPAGHPNYEVRNQTHFDEDIYLLSMGPHAHFRGKAVKIELERPDRPFRETLLWVPDYDFNWQFQYELEEPYLIPGGSTMHVTWWYDNSADNPFNPDPTVDVSYGPATTDEMMNARIYYAKAEPRGIVVGQDIPEDILTISRQGEERARRVASEWEMDSPACPVPGVASR